MTPHPRSPAAAAPCAVRCLEGLAAIRSAAAGWQALADERAHNSPFAGPGFTLAALQAYHEGEQPVLYAAERAGRLDGVLPLIRRPLQRWGAPVDQLMFPHNPQFILGDPLLDGADAAGAEEVARTLLLALGEQAWDTLVLQHLPPDTAKALLNAALALGFGCDGLETSRSLYYAALVGSHEDYLATRSRDHRWQLKKFARRAAEAGGLAIERLDTPQAIAAAFPAWFEIERNSWQGATPGAAMTDRDRHFMQLLLSELPAGELGELWLLRIGGAPAAALRMLRGPGRTCVHTMHFDQQYKDVAAGTLLLAAMLEDACRRGLGEVDFHGNGAHFKRWATGQRPLFSLRLYRPGLRGAIFRQARRMYRTVTNNRVAAVQPD